MIVRQAVWNVTTVHPVHARQLLRGLVTHVVRPFLGRDGVALQPFRENEDAALKFFEPTFINSAQLLFVVRNNTGDGKPFPPSVLKD